ncbi:50S ribosomal protein L17 [Helicobacter sp. MIT 05-5293]|uniref:Large ribosomal subunit protein bL17 n=1 Tax=uncultured Helicobacter sp. TaxID=175537 RepID=A0A650EKK6_9HELI|nr:50S ribosomal protein L17 [Helicobacter sp. MIT 05-5293]QGT49972.1 50S ribosomal protein L17 [uncultured Helicobacter sp.]TLD81815.1 50S ribosomal protein L17 [Helicobacter sp. MIT 05-5293]
MRHKHGYRKLGRTSAHRKALLKNLAIALIEYEKIETGVFKAKELQSYIEKLVTTAKQADLNTHRYVFAHLQSKSATKKLISEIAPRYLERNGGYTRIQRTRLRRGDASPMAIIEFVS